MTIKVLINGANGKMGRVTVETIADQPNLTLVAKTGRDDDLATAIIESQADVVVDFTTPQSVFENTQTIIANNARPVIGTTGLSIEQRKSLQEHFQQKSLGGIIAPNFSLGAAFMMK